MIEKLIAMAPDIQAGNASRGFWDDKETKSKGEAVMLMITELSEAVEAHRKDRHASVNISRSLVLDSDTSFQSDTNYWTGVFTTHVKDTVEDEIADTVIRILDYCHGFNLAIIDREFRQESKLNFAEDVLRISYYCINALHTDTFYRFNGFVTNTHIGKDWGYVLAAIIKFCEWYEIDLLKHIEWKLKYNSTRPRLHGKKY